MRTKFEGNASAQQTTGKDNFRRDQGAARAISSFIDPSLNWADLKELVDAAQGMKVVLKGVQCWEDAVMAAEAGLDGVVLSNHGGRQLVSALTIQQEQALKQLARTLPPRRWPFCPK